MANVDTKGVTLVILTTLVLPFLWFIWSKIDTLDSKMETRLGATDAVIQNVGSSIRTRIGEADTSLKNRIGQVDMAIHARIGQVDTAIQSRIGQVDTAIQSRLNSLQPPREPRLDSDLPPPPPFSEWFRPD